MRSTMSADILDRVYDAYAGELGQSFMRETQRRINWMCAAVQGASVLDVGCSQGLVPILLGREGKSVIGIDSSAEAIKDAERRLAAEPSSVRKRVTFVEGDFATQAFNGLALDTILMGEVLEHLFSPERFIAAAAERLKPGGRLVVTVPFGINDHIDHKHTFYLLEPYRLLRDDFDIVEVSILGKWLGLVGVRRASSTASESSWGDDDLRRLEEAFFRVERELASETVNLRARLEDANAKYRSSTEEIARLKREVVHQEAERKNAERSRVQLESQLSSQEPGAHNDPALEHERGLRHEREVMLARLEEKLTSVGQLRAFELDTRDKELAAISQSRAELSSRVAELERSLAVRQEEAERRAASHHAELTALYDRCTEASNLAAQSERKAAALELQLRKNEIAHDGEIRALHEALEQRAHALSEMGRELEVLRQQAGTSVQREAELQANREALTRAQALAAELESKGRAAMLEAKHANSRADDAEFALNAARSGALETERKFKDQQRDLERTLENQRLLARNAEAKAAQLKSELETLRGRERSAKAQLDAERRERINAERRVVQTRNTLSFQLGYELIHGFKSRSGLAALPKHLWQLQQEAARRRRERNQKHLAPPPAVAPLARRAPVEPRTQPPAVRVDGRSHAPAPAMAKAPSDISRARVACIHDEFTFASFAPECELLQLTPGNWLAELEQFRPQLLFVESAWRGKEDLWNRKVAQRGQELIGIIDWCRAAGIPTVFWNKEDPVHYRTFLNTAKLFDVVFTTDIDCVPAYKRALGHDRVHLLPFAVQPKAHNPLEKYERKNAIAFAGAYYARYPERQADLASFADNFGDAPRLEIYDRNHGKTDPDYQFPERYRSYIVGTLPFKEIDKAYKGYRYALNLNSIKSSQTMFARRVYELLASNTITVSNFSRGVRLMFGDLVITTDRGERALAKLQSLAADESNSRRFRLAGLRKVLSEHTYADRLRFMASQVWQRPMTSAKPHVCMLARAHTRSEAERAFACFERQAYAQKSLILVAGSQVDCATYARPGQIQCFTEQDARATSLRAAVSNASHIASFSSRDYYGKNYLVDLALATTYSLAPVIGKVSRYRRDNGSFLLLNDGAQYRPAASLAARAAIVRREFLPDVSLASWVEALETRVLDSVQGLAVDEFNYCEDGAADEATAAKVDDLPMLDVGLPLGHFLAERKTSHTAARTASSTPSQIEASRLQSLFRPGPDKPIVLTSEGTQLVVHSSLADETHEYLYAKEVWALAELGLPHSGKLHFEATPGLNLQLGVLFLDERKQRLGHKLCQPGANETLSPPSGTRYVQLALRVYGAGTAKLGGILLDHLRDTPEAVFGRGDYLLVTNRYPSDQDLYRNAFVHRRVVDYVRLGAKVDVFRLSPSEKVGYYEFDGLDVITGGTEGLDALLRSNHYQAILVHFLDGATWSVLAPWVDKTRLLIWAHGAEIQAWHRRKAHFGTPAALEKARADEEPRRSFWRDVLGSLPESSKVVFVSRHFAEEVLSDLQLTLPPDRYEVIHNVIDTDLFAYREKSSEHRKRVLSIRPFTSRIYANDLTVAAILALAERAYFSELDFHLVGDGPLFEDTLEPLRGLPNVRIERRFLTQREIAALHEEYGIFLCPTRGDTQGVSRDEAMSSGLVPVTSRAGAIPEFVDSECGMIADAEDALGLAAGIARLYEDEDLFLRLSRQAAQRVRTQSDPSRTTERELALIRGVVKP